MGREKKERGSAAIEAVVCLTIFISAIVAVLGFINICRAQAAVSGAVDAVAKEMSQYAYFYHIAGLDKLEQQIGANVSADNDKLENIMGGSKAMFMIFSDMGSGEKKAGDMTDVFLDAEQTVKNSEGKVAGVTSTEVNYNNAGEKIGHMVEAFKAVDDPMEFLQSIATVGAMEGASFLKSQLIAAPLAQILVKKHFEVNGMDADTYLQTLKIDGMDALNFKMSTIFAPATPNDIHIVCYYQIQPVQFFNFDFGTVVLCKEARTRAWLGGDHKYEAQEKKKDETGIWSMPSLEYGKHIVGEESKKLLNSKDAVYVSVTGNGADVLNTDKNEWIHIRSIDIYSATYTDPQKGTSAILSSLRKDYNALENASGTKKEKIKATVLKDGKEESQEVTSNPSTRTITMVVVVPEGEETAEFKAAWEQLKNEVGEEHLVKKSGYGKSPKDVKKEEKTEEEKDS